MLRFTFTCNAWVVGADLVLHFCCSWKHNLAINSSAEPGSSHCYKSFPANTRSEEQEEKRKAILALASGASKQVPRYDAMPASFSATNFFQTINLMSTDMCQLPRCPNQWRSKGRKSESQRESGKSCVLLCNTTIV
jgi:hypothetical protein